MDTWMWIAVVVIAILLLVGFFAALRRRQRSGDVLAVAGRGTNQKKDES